jgi:uncharacterized protein involved in exopolysaccharide biosynthesis
MAADRVANEELSMAVKPTDEVQPEDAWAPESGSDWRDRIVMLASWWKEIAVITVICALLGGLVAVALNSLGGPQYKAWADVAIVRTTSELNFDQRFTTTSETDIRYIATNAVAWRSALIGLAQGPDIAEQVVGQLGDLLDAQQRIPVNLANDVKAASVGGGGSAGESDLIRITATADTPERAARIATAWAEVYVRKVNQIYGQAPDELLASIQVEQARAEADYEKAQSAVEDFIANNQVDELNRQVNEKQDVIEQMAKARAALTTSYFDTETKDSTARFERWLQVNRALDQARTLRSQVAAAGGGSAGSSALVADLLKLQALTQVLDEEPAPPETTDAGSARQVQVQVGTTPLQIQLNANSTLSREELLADIDGLTQALEQRRGELEQQIASAGELLLSSDMYAVLAQAARGGSSLARSLQAQPVTTANAATVSTVPSSTTSSELLTGAVRNLEAEVRDLRSQLEKENARGNQLTQERDLARDTLKTVNSKVAELALARAAAGSEVRFATPAVPPAAPEGSGAVKAATYGGILGFLVSVFMVLVANEFGMSPFFSKGQAKNPDSPKQ